MTWKDVAPTKPANAANPFDPAYKFNDIDEFVRNAQTRNAEVLIDDLGHAAVGERRTRARTTCRRR